MTFKREMKIGVAAAALLIGFAGLTAAQAGGFSVREQSAHYQGMSFAGVATGQTLSAMAWNSAAAASVSGFNTESSYSLVIPNSEITATGGLLKDNAAAFGISGNESGNVGQLALVPASYANYQVNDRLFLGLALYSPFGFTTKPENRDWVGSPIGATSKVFDININPTVAYKLTPELTVGVGAQIEYFNIRLNSGNINNFPAAGVNLGGRETKGDDWGLGYTAGVTWKATPGTIIGVGYRSEVEFDLEGSCRGRSLSTFSGQGGAANIPASLALCNGDINANITLPQMVTASISQRISSQLTVLGTVEWTDWSVIQSPAIVNNAGVAVDSLGLHYKDGWFYSLGAEYAYSPKLTLRGGAAWELSPISDRNRNVLLPDSDRIWGSLGMTYKYSSNISFDFAYSHLFYGDGDIKVKSGSTTLLTATSDTSIDIVSAGVKYHVGGPREQLEPLK